MITKKHTETISKLKKKYTLANLDAALYYKDSEMG